MDEPSFRASLRNWRDWDGSVLEKARLALRNNVLKAKKRRNCCGNHGEPGC